MPPWPEVNSCASAGMVAGRAAQSTAAARVSSLGIFMPDQYADQYAYPVMIWMPDQISDPNRSCHPCPDPRIRVAHNTKLRHRLIGLLPIILL